MAVASELDNLEDKVNWHWRNSMRVVRFLAFDARAALPLPILLVYARWSTLILTVVTLLIFRFMENKGLTVPSAIRSLRSWIIGDHRPGWITVYRKKFIDYG